ncbi:GNAT family N-acetyltransferase [Arthrobacter sp. Soil763]|uniref:GNAT family N-acetyltransferase n=1 Tax=Arthrobacter sp. Soil763 TaxID=1736402 RepID=UPI000AEC0ABB|nr:GNAT family N-acetyltransferase [Arthrobacter sp. Soil763]
MNPLIILTAPTGAPEGSRPGTSIRPIHADDLPSLSRMYREAYEEGLPQPADRSVGWIDALLAGTRGRRLPEASAVKAGPDGTLAAAIIVTEPAPGSDGDWDSVIAELFTHPDHRRQGLAEELLAHCLQALQAVGRHRVAVTVDSGNSAALALYLSRDFRRATVDDAD